MQVAEVRACLDPLWRMCSYPCQTPLRCQVLGGVRAHVAPLPAEAEVAVPDPEGVVRHQGRGGDQHEAVADPERVREAPEQLPQRLRVPRDANHSRVPQMQLGFVHRRHLRTPGR